MTEVLSWVLVLLGTSAIVGAPALSGKVSGWRVRAVQRCRKFWEGYRELHERQGLLRRPWEEELLHWSWDGQTWQLHGHLDPPPGRRSSTTRGGWCPASRAGLDPAKPGQGAEQS